jgi:hypothetical protein
MSARHAKQHLSVGTGNSKKTSLSGLLNTISHTVFYTYVGLINP